VAARKTTTATALNKLLGIIGVSTFCHKKQMQNAGA
jgi:hypothetical protein